MSLIKLSAQKKQSTHETSFEFQSLQLNLITFKYIYNLQANVEHLINDI